MPKGVYVRTPEMCANMKKNHPDFSGKNHPMYGKHRSVPAWSKGLTKETDERLYKMGVKVGNAIRGVNHPMYGKHHTPEAIEKIIESVVKRSRAGENNYWLGKRGEEHPRWKGGVSSLAHLIRTCVKYGEWKMGVFVRDDFTCRLCHQRGGGLEADHYPVLFRDVLREHAIKTLEEGIACEELWDINSGRTLCVKCHKKHHLEIGFVGEKLTVGGSYGKEDKGSVETFIQ